MAKYDPEAVKKQMAELVAGLDLPADKQKEMYRELQTIADAYASNTVEGRLTAEQLLSGNSGLEATTDKPKRNPFDRRTYPEGTRYAVISPKEIH